MKLNKNIKGFTLVEMLITMSLSAIAIALGYLSYNYIFSSFVNYQSDNALIKEYTNLYRFTNSLVQNSKSMEYKENVLVLHLNNETDASLIISGTNVILASPEVDADTFKVNLQNAEFYFDEKKIEQEGNITKFVLNTEFSKQAFPLSFEKTYDSETLMRLDSVFKTNFHE